MPRYVIERAFPQGLSIPMDDVGQRFVRMIVSHNTIEGVTWIHSYVSADRKKTFCIYDAPTVEALGAAAERNELPAGEITEVSVLDPYFYRN